MVTLFNFYDFIFCEPQSQCNRLDVLYEFTEESVWLNKKNKVFLITQTHWSPHMEQRNRETLNHFSGGTKGLHLTDPQLEVLKPAVTWITIRGWIQTLIQTWICWNNYWNKNTYSLVQKQKTPHRRIHMTTFQGCEFLCTSVKIILKLQISA